MFSPIICHIPHASIVIPEEYRKDYLVVLPHELLQMTDLYTEDLFDLPGEKLIFPVSRLVCDVERFRDDELEPMAAIGMGAVYTTAHDLTPLRSVIAAQREEILRRWYDPHHEKLTRLTRERLEAFGHCLIIDCHSFSPTPLPYESDCSPNRPDICIGTDDYHTPPALAQQLESTFRELGYTVARNRPYTGALVPLPYYRTEPNVHSVMIEVNRKLYMDDSGQKTARYQKIKKDLGQISFVEYII